MEPHFLNDCWSLYFHDPSDENWNRSSFIKITDISTIEDFWAVNMIIKDHLYQAMFFLMRESIFPLWEETENRNGGYISLKILKAQVPDTWEELSAKLLSENLLKPAHSNLWNHINGISISTKRSFVIFKLWLKTHEVSMPIMYNIQCADINEMLFKAY
jgi:hypothetical protein